MKKIGSLSEFHRERTKDLLRAYFKYLEKCKKVSMPNVFKHVVNMPAERFWVSSARAAVVVAAIARGDKLNYMRPNKREMFFEIHHRVLSLKKIKPQLSMQRLVEEVIAKPAPKFYIAPGSARVLILKARKKYFLDSSLRLKRFSSGSAL